jgi:hypothetical protein
VEVDEKELFTWENLQPISDEDWVQSSADHRLQNNGTKLKVSPLITVSIIRVVVYSGRQYITALIITAWLTCH